MPPVDQPSSAPPDIDLRAPKPRPLLRPVDQHSELWARIAKPFAWFIFLLVAGVIGVPFSCIWLGRGSDPSRVEPILDWSKTVLPPVVGFASAVVGYYFGTRSSAGRETEGAEGDGG